jgi:hypothetical protein|tara:strand:+ start:3154 stop:4512 length:1359 start_codon:yes stop_codon:yes gene_type:complete
MKEETNGTDNKRDSVPDNGQEARELPENYRPALEEGVPEGRACGNCFFYDESRVNDDGDKAYCEKWDDFARGDYYCNAWQEDEENRQEVREVNLTPPAYMRAAARRGLKYYEDGLGGDGLVEATIREARAMARGSVTADKWVRIRAWIARHLSDLDSPTARPNSDGYPSAGVVAHLLWGSGPSKSSARRTLEYAEGVVGRIEQENEGRAKGEALSKIETRILTTEFEVREEADGMHLTGYAARFNEPSEPLPFIERIAPGAFKRSLKSRNDVKLLWNHDTSTVLGSSRAGTLTLSEDDKGLRVSAILPDTQAGRDARVLIQRKDVTGFSFGFTVPRGGDTWNEDGSERTLNSIRLLEVSTGVAFPAYTTTNGTAQVRGLDKIAKRAEVDADTLADAMLKLEDGEEITAEEKDILSRVISELAPKEETAPEPVGDLAMLALKKKKLELLLKGI